MYNSTHNCYFDELLRNVIRVSYYNYGEHFFVFVFVFVLRMKTLNIIKKQANRLDKQQKYGMKHLPYKQKS